MTPATLRGKLIAAGIAEVEGAYPPDSYKRRGALHGFELCRALETREQFEATLRERGEDERRQVDEGVVGGREAPIEEYWEYRCATLQIEHVYRRLLVLWGSPTLSARAVIQVAEILKESA